MKQKTTTIVAVEVDPESMMQPIISRLQAQADEQVNKRKNIEDRWLEDVRQYHGKYDEETEAQLDRNGRSKLAVKLTKQKTDGWAGRLFDMLFPNDDRNFGVKPTPSPTDQGGNPLDMADAVAKAERMERVIDDQLKESQYGYSCRRAIEDACLLGSGILKGPVISAEPKMRWGVAQGGPAHGTWVPAEDQTPTPEFRYVSPWDFFPDLTATKIADADFVFERHQMSKADLRKLARCDGFDKKAIAKLLQQGTVGLPPTHLATLQSLADVTSEMNNEKYTVWEYHGIIEPDELEAICSCMGNVLGLPELQPQDAAEDQAEGEAPDLEEDLQSPTGEEDQQEGTPAKENPTEPQDEGDGEVSDEEAAAIFGETETPEDEGDDLEVLAEVRVIIWFCQGHILKIGPHPLDSQRSLYHVFNWDKNPGSLFGNGIPTIMRDSQSSISSVYRMLHDNSGHTALPQVVIDKRFIKPADGDYNIAPGKIWYHNNPNAPIQQSFALFPVVAAQTELLNLMKVSSGVADEETALPLVAQGESGSHQTQTAQGMSMLVNAANVSFRRIVRNFDDDITVPVIKNAFEWNMQHNQDDTVKGDFRVDARGSSVLLVREVQANNLMAMAMNFGAHPVFGPMTKLAPLYRKLVQSYSLSSDELIKTDEEIQQIAQQQAEQPQQPDPNEMRAQATIQSAQINADARLQQAKMEYDAMMARLAADQNMTVEDLQVKLQLGHAKNQAMLIDNAAQRAHVEKTNLEEAKIMAARNIKEGFMTP